MRIKHAVFDFDGTIFDSMDVWDQAAGRLLQTLGRELLPGVMEEIKTMSLAQSSAYLKKLYSLDLTPEEIAQGVNKAVEASYFNDVMPKPGAVELIKWLREQGVNMCLATATDRYLIEAALKRCGLEGIFEEIFTCTEVRSGKDDPRIFRLAMEHLGGTHEDTAVFEDAFHAAETARKDGFITVGVFDPHETMGKELRDICDFYIKDHRDLEGFRRFASA